MACLAAPGGYGLWRLSSSHCVGETVYGSSAVESDDLRSNEANKPSSSAMVADVTDAIAASTFASRRDTMLSLERRTSESVP